MNILLPTNFTRPDLKSGRRERKPDNSGSGAIRLTLGKVKTWIHRDRNWIRLVRIAEWWKLEWNSLDVVELTRPNRDSNFTRIQLVLVATVRGIVLARISGCHGLVGAGANWV